MTHCTSDLVSTTMMSPLGLIELEASPSGLTRLHFVSQLHGAEIPESSLTSGAAHCAPLVLAHRSIQAYFFGESRPWDNLPLDLKLTAFQTRILTYLRYVPPGQTLTYGDLSKATLGHPRGARAVASALRANPVLLVLPCHRILPAGLKFGVGGYSGEVWRKKWLLDWEKRSERWNTKTCSIDNPAWLQTSPPKS